MRTRVLIVSLFTVLFVAGCAAGPASDWAQEDAEAAGFWAGLWHGALLIVTLVVSFFTDDVGLYEIHNSGVGYDIGFVLGILIIYGSGCSASVSRSKRKAKDDTGERIEAKVKARLKCWAEDEDWEELGEKIEKKVKAKLRRWLEEE